MELEEINDVEDKVLRLHLLREYIAERYERQERQSNIDYGYDETAMRDEMGGMMSTARAKTGNS